MLKGEEYRKLCSYPEQNRLANRDYLPIYLIKGGAAFGFFSNTIIRELYKKYGNAVEVAEEEKG